MRSYQFFKGLSWLIILNLLIKPVWIFFIDRQVQNIVGLEAYGKYFAAYNLTFVLLFLADAGLTNMLNQRLASNQSVNASQLLVIKLALLLIYSFVCVLVAWATNISQWHLVFYLIASQALASLFVFLRSIVTAHQFFTADAIFSVIDKLLMIFLCGGFIYGIFGKIDLVLFLQIQVICTTVAVAIAFIFIIQKKLFTSVAKEQLSSITKWIVPFAIIILLMSVHYRLDGFLLERIHHNGAYEAGVYASAYRLLDAGNTLGYLVASFLVPFIARNQTNKNLIARTVNNNRDFLIFLSIGVCSFAIVFAPWIQHILYHSEKSYNSTIIQLCIATLPAYYLVHVYGSLLTAAANFKLFISILFACVCINLLLNFVLIPAYGAWGCCIAALISHYFCGISLMIITANRLQISIVPRSLLLYVLSAVALVLLFYVSKVVISNVWIILAIALAATAVLLISRIGYFKKLLFAID